MVTPRHGDLCMNAPAYPCPPSLETLYHDHMAVFPTDDTERALAMLAQTFPIRIRRRLPWWATVEGR